jgi:diketogulonate reductase-like aldo/keto reductase
MAYSPLDEGPLAHHRALAAVGRPLGASAAQVALAWLVQRGVCAIPKASSPEHVRANAACAGLILDAPALQALERAFPPPRSKRPLEMI